MLIYDPALDVAHAIFRLLFILSKAGSIRLEFDRYKILDFYMLYPSALSEFKMPEGKHSSLKRAAKTWANKYNKIGSGKMTLLSLAEIQRAAVEHLTSIGILDAESARLGYLLRTEKQLPPLLVKSIELSKMANEDVAEFLWSTGLNQSLIGDGGLKARSGLMEYRYDPV